MSSLVNDTTRLLGSNIRVEPNEIIIFDKHIFGDYGMITKEVVKQ